MFLRKKARFIKVLWRLNNMPLPMPNSGETEKAFISRCMGDKNMNSEFPEQEQRAGVCYSQFRSKDKKKSRAKVSDAM